MTSGITLKVTAGVAILTIDRPEVRNAIDQATAVALGDALDQVDLRDDITVAVLTGVGGVFSAGMDLKAFSRDGQRPIHPQRGGFGIVERPPEKPIIAAIEGRALGGGLEIALACDLIVVGESCELGLPEVKRGLVAAAGGVLRLPRRIPQAVAMELILTGAPIGSTRALQLGLVNRVSRDGHALDVAVDLAREIAANAPLAVRTAKLLAQASADWPAEEAFARQEPYTNLIRGSNDAAEGARAFLEKREPEWTRS